jgi:Papain family cysteine protease
MKHFAHYTAAIIVTIFFLSCTKDTQQTKEERGTGLLPNTPTSLEKLPEADFDENKFNLPANFALDGPPIENQGQTSKCVGFSGAYYIISLYNGVTSAAQNYDKASSPEFAYAYYKKSNNEDCSEGCYMFDEGNVDGMADILKNIGTSSWNQTAFVDSKVCTITTDAQKTQAAANKISGYARLDEDEYKITKELKSWMYAGYPLWFAANVDDGFQDLGTATWSTPVGKNGGGHAMTLVGWDDTKKAFKIANSWGKGWGDNGYGWVDYDYFQVLLAQNGGTIGVLFPNDRQKTFFNNLTPSSCANAAWGDLVIRNKLTKEIKITISGTTPVYLNDGTSIDANEDESYSGLPKGDLKVKVSDSAGVLIKEFNVTITQCQQTSLDVI